MEPFELKLHQVTFTEHNSNLDTGQPVITSLLDEIDAVVHYDANFRNTLTNESSFWSKDQLSDLATCHIGISKEGFLTYTRTSHNSIFTFCNHSLTSTVLNSPVDSCISTEILLPISTLSYECLNSKEGDNLHLVNANDTFLAFLEVGRTFDKTSVSNIQTLSKISLNTASVTKHIRRNVQSGKLRIAKTNLTSVVLGMPSTVLSDTAAAVPSQSTFSCFRPMFASQVDTADSIQCGDAKDHTFDTVAEALRLQQSVIGHSNVKPASADEVAKMVADYKKRIWGEAGGADATHTVTISQPSHTDLCASDTEQPVSVALLCSDGMQCTSLVGVASCSSATDWPSLGKVSGQESGRNSRCTVAPERQKLLHSTSRTDGTFSDTECAVSCESLSEITKSNVTETGSNFSIHLQSASKGQAYSQNSAVPASTFRNDSDSLTNADVPFPDYFQKNRYVTGTLSNGDYIGDVVGGKLKLEGQMEVLRKEAQTAIQERVKLQAQIASLQLRLNSEFCGHEDIEKVKLHAEAERLQGIQLEHGRDALEARQLLEEKSGELKAVTEDLLQSLDSIGKLQARMKDVKDDLHARDITIQALKGKIAELYVEVQTILLSKTEADAEAERVKVERDLQLKSKQWYQEQLSAAHEAKAKLQTKMTQLQAETVSKASIVERLKQESGRLRHQLRDTQAKFMQDKELLAQQLEAIHLDMLEREAAFQEIQRERLMIEDTFNSQVTTVVEEKNQIKNLLQLISDLECQLELSYNKCKKKQEMVIALEHQQVNLTKKLALSEDDNIQKTHLLAEANEKLLEVESQLSAFMESLTEKDVEILMLKEGNCFLEIELTAARQEKKSVDVALNSFKVDMGKVETGFQQMREDLKLRQVELAIAEDRQKATLSEVDHVCLELCAKNNSLQTLTASQQELSSTLSRVRAEKVATENELISMTEKLEQVQLQEDNTKIFSDLFHLYQPSKVEGVLYDFGGEMSEAGARCRHLETLIQQLSLELERERDGLTGLKQSNTDMKEYTNQLEETLASRELSLAEMKAHHVDNSWECQHGAHLDLVMTVQRCELDIRKEKDLSRDLRKQIGTKIIENKRLQKQHDASRKVASDLREDLQRSQQQITLLCTELDNERVTSVNIQHQLKSQLMARQRLESRVELMTQQMSQSADQDAVLLEQIKSLEWQLSLKAEEVQSAERQLVQFRNQQEEDLGFLQQTLQAKQRKLDNILGELSTARQEKASQRSCVSELRHIVKASVHYHKYAGKSNTHRKENVLRVDGNGVEVNDAGDGTEVDVPDLPFDINQVELLLRDTAIKPSLDSKPLEDLSACLSSLRSDICCLQKQMDCHTSTVNSSSVTWQSVQSEMKDLQEAVRSISTTIMDIGYRSPGSATSNAADVEIVDGDGTPHV